MLTALAKSRLRATMFNEGRFAAADPAGVRAEASAGMWIGNHSYTHPHLTQSGKAQIDAEISRTQQAIANAGGGTPKLFRPPSGSSNSTVRSVEAEYGLRAGPAAHAFGRGFRDKSGSSVSAFTSVLDGWHKQLCGVCRHRRASATLV